MKRFLKKLSIYAILAVGNIAFAAQSEDVTFSCGGTEPFWDMSTSAKKVKFKLVGEEGVTLSVLYIRDVMGLANSHQFNTRYTDTVITAGECNNGMSDDIFDFNVVYISPNGVYSGCCSKN